MAGNQCFYCEIQGHHAKDCCKKQADHCNYESGTNNSPGNSRSTNYPGKSEPTTNRATPGALDMTPGDISSFLKDNMGLLDEDTKLSIIESLMPKDFTKSPKLAAIVRAFCLDSMFVNKSNSIQVKILLSHYQGKAEEIALLDTGATENFIDHTTVARLCLGTKKLPYNQPVYNVDRTLN